MRISIRQLGVTAPFNIEVTPEMTVEELKEVIETQRGIPSDTQRIIIRGKVLKPGQRLSDYAIEDEDAVHLVVQRPQSTTATVTSVSATSTPAEPTSASAAFLPASDMYDHHLLMGTVQLPDSEHLPDLNQIVTEMLNSLQVFIFHISIKRKQA